ncbi:dihydroorotase [Pseudonocardia dioxanivorans]|uniref:dihydroorotase n=1 Tax=Pseudonocardia dioxanivorans TaxID=240495 RepID=UPI000CD0CD5C|nr:amidohydrolase family protein [Pseudonocardia dioxanivorans]
MLDLAIVGSDVVTPEGPRRLDIGIADGRFALLAEPGGLPEAARTVDGSGCVTLPGAVDPHVHANGPLGESLGQSRDVITSACLYGGTTTVIDFVWPSTTDVARRSITADLAERVEAWTGDSYTDFAFHVALTGDVSEKILREIPDVIADGFPSFKIFTTDIVPSGLLSGVELKVRFGTLADLFDVVARHRGIVTVHAEDDDIVMHQYRKYIDSGRTALRYMAEVHTTLSEDMSFRRVLRLAEHYPGLALYFHHVTARTGVDALREFRRRGVAAYGEAIDVIAMNTAARYSEPDGVKYHIYPSLKYAEDVDAIWEGVRDGTVNCFGTDGACPTWEQKTQGSRIDDAYGGVTGVEPKLAVLYTEMLTNRSLDLTRLVEATSSNAAKIFGLWPRKGCIAVGSDADLVLLDPRAPRVIRAAEMHEGDYSPWEGCRVDAWPAYTVLRGEVVMARGELTADRPAGRLLRRTLDDAVFAGTASAR